MKPINHIQSTAIPLPIHDIDTDQIIPTRFLKAVNRTSYADCLFADWRFENDQIKPDFWLNAFHGQILVTQSNFGCGSSREHAAWAIRDFGIQVILAPSFGDIFKTNALNNGIIPIELAQDIIEKTISETTNNPSLNISIKLDEQSLEIQNIYQGKFEINPFKKRCLLEGMDEIDFLVNLREEIITFENTSK